MKPATGLEGAEYYGAVASDVGKNVFAAVVGLGLVWFLARVWPVGARVIFWVAVVVVGLMVLKVLIFTAIGLVTLVGGHRDSKWVWYANVARLLEAAALASGVYVAARLVGYVV